MIFTNVTNDKSSARIRYICRFNVNNLVLYGYDKNNIGKTRINVHISTVNYYFKFSKPNIGIDRDVLLHNKENKIHDI